MPRTVDLSREWPLRVGVIALGAGDRVVVAALHHIAGDGWSVGILARELAAFYGGLVSGSAASLPALAVQYGDYAVWQRGWLGTGVEASELGYWRDALSGSPGLFVCRGIGSAVAVAASGRGYRGWLGRGVGVGCEGVVPG